MTVHLPTSQLLHDLLSDTPAESVTLDWLMGRLGDRSFGVVVLVLALVGVLPGVSVFAGALLTVPAFQMIMARPSPAFPSGIASCPIGTRPLVRLLHWVVPVLRRLEKVIHPRWLTLIEATKRVVGGVVVLLGLCLLVPVPLSNVPPALVIVLVALAYLQEDGMLLCASLLAALLVLATVAAAIWQAMRVTGLS